MTMPDTLQPGERAELTRRLYQLADMIRSPAASTTDKAAAAEFIARTVQNGWDYRQEAA
jgi:hypothetical protein